MNGPNGSRSPMSPDQSSSSSTFSTPTPYSNGNSPMHLAVSPASQFGYSGGTSPNRLAVHGPRLVILNQPQKKFRFRYISEMTGTHGCLMGETNERNKKEYIRVLLEGCQYREAVVRCTLVTNSAQPVPHVHRLGGEGNGNVSGSASNGEYQDLNVSQARNEWIASFSGLTIIHTAKKNVREVIERRMLADVKKRGIVLNYNDERKLKDEADSLATKMDLHSVKLKFEAFIEINGREEEICPPIYSNEIQNLKSTQAGDLRIVRIDKVYSCCTGQEEIFIFVEKVNKKDIKVRFFEVDDENCELLWEDYADFSELDVHHQYAIAFKTPAYKSLDITDAVNVQLQLYRPSNGTYSEPRGFTYTPRESFHTGKRRRPQSSTYNESDHRSLAPHQPTINRSPPYDTSSIVGGSTQPSTGSDPSASQRSPYGNKQIPLHNGMSSNVVANPPTWDHPVFQGQNIATYSQPLAQSGGIGTNYGSSLQWNISDVQLVDSQTADVLTRIIDQHNIDENLSSFLGTLFAPQDQQQCAFVPINSNNQNQPQPPLQPPLPVNAEAPPLTQPEFNLPASPVDMAQTEDPLLAGLFNSNMHGNLSGIDFWNDYVADASCSTANHLSERVQQMQISSSEAAPANNMASTQKEIKIEPKSIVDISKTSLSTILSNYSLNLAYALRYYAETGDLPHILQRMIHLLAMQSEDGDNALHDALFHNQMDVVRAMLKAASNSKNGHEFINAQNNVKQTPLHIAVLKNQPDATAMLLQGGADPTLTDVHGDTPIHIASVDSQSFDCLSFLLDSHSSDSTSNLNSRNYAGCTPLHLAINAGNLKSVKLLVSKGADVNCHEAKRGRSALQLAVRKRALDMINFLLTNASIDINQQSYDGNTALHLAILDGLEDVCSILVDKGADLTIENYLHASLLSSKSNEDADGGEDTDENEDDTSETDIVELESKGQSPLDLAQIHPPIMEILRPNVRQDADATGTNVIEPINTSVPSAVLLFSEKENVERPLDSGIDLMASKELSSFKELDDTVIQQLARCFDTPNKEWERLAHSLDLLSSMRAVFDKQPSPTSYMLRNLDLWDLNAQMVLEKLQELQFKEAASILEDYIRQ